MTGTNPPPPLYGHQRIAAGLLEEQVERENRTAFALLMEMGTGKTRVAIEHWMRLVKRGLVRDMMVIAPGGVYRGWEAAFAEWLSDQFRRRTRVLAWRSGGGSGFRERLQSFLACETDPRVFLVGVESIGTARGCLDACETFLGQRGGRQTFLCIDESTKIRGIRRTRTPNRTEHVYRLGQMVRHKVIMTGLPSPRSPLDLYSQFEFLDWRILGHRSFYTFRAQFAKLKKIKVGVKADDPDDLDETDEDDEGRQPSPQCEPPKFREVTLVTGFKNIPELRARVAPYSYRVLAKDCLDLPEAVQMPPRLVLLTAEQERLYDEIRRYAVAELGGGQLVSVPMVIQRVQKLHQIACGVVTDDQGKQHSVASNRNTVLLELLEECAGKVVIWTCYDACVRSLVVDIEKEYGKGSVARFWGGNVSTREREEQDFLTLPGCRFMVSTQAAGGMGRTWVVASQDVTHASTWDLEHREQSRRRVHRAGQRSVVSYTDLVAPGTVDEKILACLSQKLTLAQMVAGDRAVIEGWFD